jgi:hypothetical protein
MNERIKELKEQAMEWVPNQIDPDIKIRLLNAEKFAELIVRECADIGHLYEGGEYEVRNQIMAHFGVEE